MAALRDVDAAERAFRLKRLAWALPICLAAAPLGGFLASRADLPGPLLVVAVIAGFVAGPLIVYLASGLLIDGAGALFEQLHNPSGRLPPKRDYSYIASLAVRGRLEEAADAYADAAERFPDDPEPLLLMARLCRDRLDRPEDAERWFRRVLALPDVAMQAELAASKELIALCTRRLDRPGRALAELDRLARKFEGSPTGDWAARTQSRLKDSLRSAAEAAAAEEPLARKSPPEPAP